MRGLLAVTAWPLLRGGADGVGKRGELVAFARVATDPIDRRVLGQGRGGLLPAGLEDAPELVPFDDWLIGPQDRPGDRRALVRRRGAGDRSVGLLQRVGRSIRGRGVGWFVVGDGLAALSFRASVPQEKNAEADGKHDSACHGEQQRAPSLARRSGTSVFLRGRLATCCG